LHLPRGGQIRRVAKIERRMTKLEGWQSAKLGGRRTRSSRSGGRNGRGVAGVVSFLRQPRDSDYMRARLVNVDGGLVMGN